jgi:hypothetical protein
MPTPDGTGTLMPDGMAPEPDSKLAPGGTYAYRVYEASGTAQSPGSALASVRRGLRPRSAPPAESEARSKGPSWWRR